MSVSIADLVQRFFERRPEFGVHIIGGCHNPRTVQVFANAHCTREQARRGEFILTAAGARYPTVSGPGGYFTVDAPKLLATLMELGLCEVKVTDTGDALRVDEAIVANANRYAIARHDTAAYEAKRMLRDGVLSKAEIISLATED